MPSFDVVSQVDLNEVSNAVNQATRELDNRFDFKGTNAKFELTDSSVTLRAPNEFQINQMYDILTARFAIRKINVRCLEREATQQNVSDAWQIVQVKQGIDTDLARQLVKLIKQAKMKVQVAIQGDQLRVSGNKKDSLQKAIELIKEQDVRLPLQFINFRD